MRWARSNFSVLLLAFACHACVQPANVVLYDERQQRPAAVDHQVASRDSGRPVRAPVPRANPARSAPNRSGIERKQLPPPGRQQALNAAPLSATTAASANTVTTHDRRAVASYQPVPKDGLHTVTPKETIYAISRRYGVPVRSLLLVNGLEPPFILKLGQRVKVPAQRRHLVIKGETVYAISRRYDVSIKELVRLNGVGEPFKIKTGQTLLLPDSDTSVVLPVSLPGSSGSVDAPPSDSARRAPPPNRTVLLPPSTNIPKPSKLSGKGFLWPLSGKIISRYGRKGRGLHNDGINIAAPRGTPVRAAQNGVVAYYGNELRGFGNLILIKHDRDYMTAYAHADKVLVKRGQRVKRGQVIARVGSSGSVAAPQLHFEIRKGRRPVDPVRYLNRRQATAPTKGTVKRYSDRPGLATGGAG